MDSNETEQIRDFVYKVYGPRTKFADAQIEQPPPLSEESTLENLYRTVPISPEAADQLIGFWYDLLKAQGHALKPLETSEDRLAFVHDFLTHHVHLDEGAEVAWKIFHHVLKSGGTVLPGTKEEELLQKLERRIQALQNDLATRQDKTSDSFKVDSLQLQYALELRDNPDRLYIAMGIKDPPESMVRDLQQALSKAFEKELSSSSPSPEALVKQLLTFENEPSRSVRFEQLEEIAPAAAGPNIGNRLSTAGFGDEEEAEDEPTKQLIEILEGALEIKRSQEQLENKEKTEACGSCMVRDRTSGPEESPETSSSSPSSERLEVILKEAIRIKERREKREKKLEKSSTSGLKCTSSKGLSAPAKTSFGGLTPEQQGFIEKHNQRVFEQLVLPKLEEAKRGLGAKMTSQTSTVLSRQGDKLVRKIASAAGPTIARDGDLAQEAKTVFEILATDPQNQGLSTTTQKVYKNLNQRLEISQTGRTLFLNPHSDVHIRSAPAIMQALETAMLVKPAQIVWKNTNGTTQLYAAGAVRAGTQSMTRVATAGWDDWDANIRLEFIHDDEKEPAIVTKLPEVITSDIWKNGVHFGKGKFYYVRFGKNTNFAIPVDEFPDKSGKYLLLISDKKIQYGDKVVSVHEYGKFGHLGSSSTLSKSSISQSGLAKTSISSGGRSLSQRASTNCVFCGLSPADCLCDS